MRTVLAAAFGRTRSIAATTSSGAAAHGGSAGADARRAARSVGAGIAGTLTSLLLAGVALGASPTPSRPPSTDTRSALEGPGFVGSPELAILGVLAIAAVALLATFLYVRMSGGPGNRAR